ncbi:MAG: hypothetical protein ABWX69_04155 [Arthrobacter sp.]
MTQDHPQDPAEEAGGYGTPTAEQEMPAKEPGAGRSGGTEKQLSSENASTGSDASGNSQAAVPSSEAEMDDANTEQPDAGRPFSSEPGQDAAGLPDGSGTDLPEEKSPKDRDDEEPFDAG